MHGWYPQCVSWLITLYKLELASIRPISPSMMHDKMQIVLLLTPYCIDN